MSHYPKECPVFADAGDAHGEIMDWYYMEQDDALLVLFSGQHHPFGAWYFLSDLRPLTLAARQMAKDIEEGTT